ncbi:hypothetical protein [Brevundimonas sp. NPDC058933]|uniref:hypothetical protein n=1 Tax=Brevundimonas sp. NPDC058933 TaxID=3346673 RepID=UPI003BEEF3F5
MTAPGRYVFVVDRMEMARQRRAELLALCEQLGRTLHIETITGDDDPKGVGNVGRRIQEAGAELSGNLHCVVIVTHAGMIRCRDWSGYALWDAIIVDEVPNILDREDHPGGRFWSHALERFYTLTQTGVDGVSVVGFAGGLSPHELPDDLRTFHQRVIAGEAHVSVAAWSDLDAGPWSSWRLWDVTKLAGLFGEIVFLADAFDQSEAYHLMSLNPAVRFQRFRVREPRPWADRPVTVRYVSEDRVAASSRFKSEVHAADMAKVWDWLALETDPLHLWTVNAGARVSADITGKRVTPKQAGSNAYRSWHKASAIYAAKPSPMERKFYAMLGIEADVIVASREAYDLNQFFMRTSLRDPASTAPVELRCFDRVQAQTFADKLASDYGLTADLVHDDIGLTLAPVNRGGRPPKNGAARMSVEERREANRLAQQRRRQKNNAAPSKAA